MILTAQELDKRREIIVSELDGGTASTVQLALIYGITRERVSQIYYKALGYKRRGELLRRQHIKAKERRLTYNLTIKFFCDNPRCEKMVNRLTGKYKRRYCPACSDLLQSQRSIENSYTCNECSKEYYPFRQGIKPRKYGNFCSRVCYFTFLKKGNHGKKVGKKRN